MIKNTKGEIEKAKDLRNRFLSSKSKTWNFSHSEKSNDEIIENKSENEIENLTFDISGARIYSLESKRKKHKFFTYSFIRPLYQSKTIFWKVLRVQIGVNLFDNFFMMYLIILILYIIKYFCFNSLRI